MSFTRTKTLYTMKSWPTDINVYDSDRVWWFRNNMINRSVAWQCFDADQYYFKTEEDLEAYIKVYKRDQNLDKLL